MRKILILAILTAALAGCAKDNQLAPMVSYPLGPTRPPEPGDLLTCRFGIDPGPPAKCVGA